MPEGREVPSLELCLTSGQSFAWQFQDGIWIGTICGEGFALRQISGGIEYDSSSQEAASILRDYFAWEADHDAVVAQLPRDEFLQEAVRFCSGLRLLRQDPWECLAGFILSSTKQIVHIQQIWKKLGERYGKRLAWPAGGDASEWPQVFSFLTRKSWRRYRRRICARAEWVSGRRI